MEKLKNKNTIMLIISAVLILIAIIVAVVASTSSGGNKKETTPPDTSESVSIDLEALAAKNTTTKAQQNSYVFKPGKYTVATKDDPLGLKLEPNTDSARIISVPKGHQVEVLAVWEDWGYVVYEKTGGWLSMNYLELVSGKAEADEPATTANGQ